MGRHCVGLWTPMARLGFGEGRSHRGAITRGWCLGLGVPGQRWPGTAGRSAPCHRLPVGGALPRLAGRGSGLPGWGWAVCRARVGGRSGARRCLCPQVCDSDTVLDPACTAEMLRILEADPRVGGVGGDVQVARAGRAARGRHGARGGTARPVPVPAVPALMPSPPQILNKYDSWISFLSSVRYWMAFNVERACQSYFGCVQCISGPLGMYRNALLQQFLEDWYHQTFLGSKCSFGDDRHLTNRVLSLGYQTKYTARSKCLTETPTRYLRWLNQQTRWSKSYFREWLYNALWFHKHHLWMTYESVVTGFFPFFLIATVIQLFYRGRIWNILLFLLTVQLVGIIKATYACFLRGSAEMIFVSLYSLLYMSSLLPAKMFAIATINKSGWGTSGRRTIVVNFVGLLPVSVWVAVLLGGLAYTAYSQDLLSDTEVAFLVSGAILYACYWVALLTLYLAIVARRCGKRQEQCGLAFAEV